MPTSEPRGADAPAAPDILTARQAAAFLQISLNTMRLLAQRGELRGRKVGREWRFSRATLERWISQGGLGASTSTGGSAGAGADATAGPAGEGTST